MVRILIVGQRGDPHLEAVCWGLQRLAQHATVWNWSDFPKRDASFLKFGADTDPSFGFEMGGERVDAPFDVIWVRRRGEPSPMEGSHSDDIPVVCKESKKFFDNILPYLGHPGTRWINHPDADLRCRNKADQLLAAKAEGFTIPETLIGNDVAEVREFFRQHQGNIVHKGFSHLSWTNEDRSRTVGRTSTVTAEHLSGAFAVRACPGIYQKKIEKRHELRVTVMGETVVPAAIYSQQDGETTDWRCEGGRGQTNLRAIAIEPALADRCRALCRALGLGFGCIDLIVTPDGGVVFLEVNCIGQFLFTEIADPAIPMLDAFCHYLVHGDSGKPAGAPALTMTGFFEERARAARADHAAAA